MHTILLDSSSGQLGFDLFSTVTTLITVLGAGGLYKIFDRFLKNKESTQQLDQKDGIAFRKTLLDKIERLEKKEEENRKEILKLTKQLAESQMETKLLRQELSKLKG